MLTVPKNYFSGDFVELALVIVVIWLIADAIKGYKAERYAQKTVFGRKLSFPDYMCSKHPIMSTCIIIFLLLTVIAIFLEIF
ncbi:hypothetical protein B5F94_05995 [Flavonifractor sp. An4]|nr:hypothetical protein B5F94_05995 [Flavonifractor sp. An4]